MASNGQRPVAPWNRTVTMVGVALAGCAVSLAVGLALRRSVREEERTTFFAEAMLLAQAIEQRLDRPGAVLEATAAYFDASQDVGRDEFRTYAHALMAHFPAMTALGWAPRVWAEERAAFEAEVLRGASLTAARPDGGRGPSPAAPEYLPLLQVETRAHEPAAFVGFDLASVPPIRRLVTRARAGHLPVATRLSGADDFLESRTTILALLQRQRASTSRGGWSAEDRPGVLVVAFALDALLAPAVESARYHRLAFVLRPSAEGTPVFQLGDPGDAPPEGGPSWQAPIRVGEERWSIVAWPGPGFYEAFPEEWPWFITGAGLGLTFVVVLFMVAMQRRTRQVEALVEQRTAELTQAKAALEDDVARRQTVEHALRRLGRDLERRVEERTASLLTAYEELESFSYAASHDLRAPVRTLSGFSDILLEDFGDRLDGEGRALLERLGVAAERLGGTIDAMLDVSRTSRTELHAAPVDVPAMARQVAAALLAIMPGRRVELEVTGEATARADPRLVRVVLQNLLDNALKFTARRDVAHIRVACAETDDEAVCSVSDDGVGFDMAHVGRLFQPFQRLHLDDALPGTGVGLALVRRIVHRHGGDVRASGAPGEGATFTFTLPLAR